MRGVGGSQKSSCQRQRVRSVWRKGGVSLIMRRVARFGNRGAARSRSSLGPSNLISRTSCLHAILQFFARPPTCHFSSTCISEMAPANAIPSGASAAVLMPSEPMPDFAVSVEGPNFEQEVSLKQLLESYKRIGFQANSLGKAIDIVNKMVRYHTNHHLTTHQAPSSASGGSQTSPSPRTNPRNTWTRRSEQTRSATSSWAIRRISSRLVSGKSCYTS